MRGELPKRKNIRLKDYDYSSNGAYFITICVKDRHNLLWECVPVGAALGRPPMPEHPPLSESGALSELGQIVDIEINKIEKIYDTAKIDKYVIMPNHIHMIIILNDVLDADGRPKAAPTISRILNKFKGSISKQIGYSIWQKLFHDHIIRNETEYQKIWRYIDENPAKLEEDSYFK